MITPTETQEKIGISRQAAGASAPGRLVAVPGLLKSKIDEFSGHFPKAIDRTLSRMLPQHKARQRTDVGPLRGATQRDLSRAHV